MRVVIIADGFFASRERPLLERVEVGLADEGVRVIHAVPESSSPNAATGLYSHALTYSPRTLALTLPLQARRLARSILEIDASEGGRGIDLVHAFGGSVWRLARQAASLLGAGLVLEVWRAGLVPQAMAGAGLGRKHAPRALLLAPDVTIERLLVTDLGSSIPIRVAHWGVHSPLQPRTPFPPDRAWTAAMVGSGLDAVAFSAALQGLAAAAKARPDLLIFADAVAARRSGLWKAARHLGLLDRLSIIEELEGRRDLLLQADVLVLPEAKGEQRSVLLEAMASGMIVAAAADPLVTVLQDGRTARLVSNHALWGAILTDIVSNTPRTLALALSANEFVRQFARASDHVRAVLTAYRSLVPDGSVPFRAR